MPATSRAKLAVVPPPTAPTSIGSTKLAHETRRAPIVFEEDPMSKTIRAKPTAEQAWRNASASTSTKQLERPTAAPTWRSSWSCGEEREGDWRRKNLFLFFFLLTVTCEAQEGWTATKRGRT